MGLIINSAAILASTLTAICLYLGINPLYSIALGAVIIYAPIKLLLPFGSKKPVSETGLISGFLTATMFGNLGYSLLYSWAIGLISGYFYLYWWIFIFPKIIPKGNKRISIN